MDDAEAALVRGGAARGGPEKSSPRSSLPTILCGVCTGALTAAPAHSSREAFTRASACTGDVAASTRDGAAACGVALVDGRMSASKTIVVTPSLSVHTYGTR